MLGKVQMSIECKSVREKQFYRVSQPVIVSNGTGKERKRKVTITFLRKGKERDTFFRVTRKERNFSINLSLPFLYI